MPDIYLNVPFVSQLGFGNPDHPMNDRTGCWYAAACMVGYYFEAGPRLGMPEKYDPAKGHSAMKNDEYPTLMANEHLVAEPLPPGKAWTGDQLAELLRKYGPLSFGWNKTSATSGKVYGHRSVLIGWDEGKGEVIFHDPEKAPNSRLSLANFNAKFRWSNPYAMLHREAGGPT